MEEERRGRGEKRRKRKRRRLFSRRNEGKCPGEERSAREGAS